MSMPDRVTPLPRRLATAVTLSALVVLAGCGLNEDSTADKAQAVQPLRADRPADETRLQPVASAELSANPAPKSTYQTSHRERVTKVLATAAYGTLVAPCAIAAGGHGLDFIGPETFSILSFDYPARPYWRAEFSPSEHGDLESIKMQRIDYATSHYAWVQETLNILGDEARAATDRALDARFHGNPYRALYQAEALQHRGEAAVAKVILLDAIKARPNIWKLYFLAAKALVEDGDYSGANSAFDAYPGFRDPDNESAVLLSNVANEAGSLFFWRGKLDYAAAYYQNGKAFGSYSEGDLISQIRLAILARDLGEAAKVSIQRAQRYSSPYAYRDYLSLLFAFGFNDEAWAGFQALAGEFDNPQVWMAAMVGNRRLNRSDAEFRQWLMAPELRNLELDGRRIAAAHAVMHYTTDRDLPADFAQFVADLAGPSIAKVEGNFVMRQRPGEAYSHLIGPTVYARHDAVALKDGEPVPSELAYFAEGYASWRQGDAQQAAKKFDRLARYYNLFLDDYKWILPYFVAALSATTDDGRFHERLLEWTRQFSRLEPFSAWAHAYVARYSDDPEERRHALGAALFLDPQSARIKEIPPDEMTQAAAEFTKDKLFVPPSQSSDDSGA